MKELLIKFNQLAIRTRIILIAALLIGVTGLSILGYITMVNTLKKNSSMGSTVSYSKDSLRPVSYALSYAISNPISSSSSSISSKSSSSSVKPAPKPAPKPTPTTTSNLRSYKSGHFNVSFSYYSDMGNVTSQYTALPSPYSSSELLFFSNNNTASVVINPGAMGGGGFTLIQTYTLSSASHQTFKITITSSSGAYHFYGNYSQSNGKGIFIAYGKAGASLSSVKSYGEEIVKSMSLSL